MCPGTGDEECLVPEAWNETFGDALRTAKIGKRQRVTNWLLKCMMGLARPKAMQTDGRIAYSMTRAPKGTVKLLYLDDEMRVTVGNAGSVVVAERV